MSAAGTDKHSSLLGFPAGVLKGEWPPVGSVAKMAVRRSCRIIIIIRLEWLSFKVSCSNIAQQAEDEEQEDNGPCIASDALNYFFAGSFKIF